MIDFPSLGEVVFSVGMVFVIGFALGCVAGWLLF